MYVLFLFCGWCCYVSRHCSFSCLILLFSMCFVSASMNKELIVCLIHDISLMSMWRCFNRVLNAEICRKAAASKIRFPALDMRTEPIFAYARAALVQSMKNSTEEGANQPRQKSEAITFKTEAAMLADMDNSITHPRGCQRVVAWYSLSRFFVRGGKELYNILDTDFTFGVDSEGPFVR